MSEAPRDARRARRRAECLCQPLVRRRRGDGGGLLTGPRRVLGIDPGSRRTGWAILTGTLYQPVLIAAGEIVVSGRLAFETRLARLQHDLNSVLDEHDPTEAAVETPFHGVSARSALQLAHARGAILAALGAASIPVCEYAPTTIKKAVTGRGHADKTQVQMMVARLTSGVAVGRGADLADAVAAALCHLTGARPARSEGAGARRTRVRAVR